MTDREFQVGDKVTVWGCFDGRVEWVSKSDSYRSIGVWTMQTGSMSFHPFELTFVEPVKQWRPLPEGVTADGRGLRVGGYGFVYSRDQIDTALDWTELKQESVLQRQDAVTQQLDALDRSAKGLHTLYAFWPEFEETQGMEQ